MSNKFIQKITIQNYKSIKKLTNFELHNINILIGANGAGKSNFLSFFNLVRNIIRGSLSSYTADRGMADGVLTFGRKHSEFLEAQIEFEDNLYGFKLLPNMTNSFYFDDEFTTYKSNNKTWHLPRKGYTESLIDSPESRSYHAKYFVPQFKKILQYHFHDTGDSAPMKLGDAIYDNSMLKFDGRNLASFLYRLYTNEFDSYTMIVKTIRMVVPDFYDFYFPQDIGSTEKLVPLWINVNDRDSIQHPSFLSDGSLRFICLVTVLLQPLDLMPDIVIIDEPELGLHPHALVIVADLMERISLQKQFIIATQSSVFVDLFSAEDIIVVNKDLDGTSIFDRLNTDDLSNWLQEYNVSDLWDMNLIGGRP